MDSIEDVETVPIQKLRDRQLLLRRRDEPPGDDAW